MSENTIDGGEIDAARRIPREKVLEVLRRFYGPDRVAEARRALPDTVDLDRDATLLVRFHLTREELSEAGGMSP